MTPLWRPELQPHWPALATFFGPVVAATIALGAVAAGATSWMSQQRHDRMIASYDELGEIFEELNTNDQRLIKQLRQDDNRDDWTAAWQDLIQKNTVASERLRHAEARAYYVLPDDDVLGAIREVLATKRETAGMFGREELRTIEDIERRLKHDLGVLRSSGRVLKRSARREILGKPPLIVAPKVDE